MHSARRHSADDTDLLVIGGGINGAGVARDAALRGLRVELVEQNDFGSGASSHTSKLVHGGLRYLEQGSLKLVWEACRERRTLLRIAPHLVQPRSFLLPVFRSSRVGPWRLRAGMWLYDLMAAFRNVHRHRMLGANAVRQAFAGLRNDDLRGAALYWDASMNDARLVLENVLAARDAGASVSNYQRVTRLRIDAGRVRGAILESRQTGASRSVSASLTVLCTGSWTDELLQPLPGAGNVVEPTRGTHILLRRFTEQAWTLAAARDGRIFFVLPWLGMNLVGTTDEPDTGNPDRVAPTEAEITYLLAEANGFFPAARLERSDVVAAFAGLRPLLAASGDASARSREHVILEPAPGLLAIAGGKYTTYRAVAEAAVDRVGAQLGVARPCTTDQTALPGGDLSWSATDQWQRRGGFHACVVRTARCTGLDASVVEHLYATYGCRAQAIVDAIADAPHLGAPLCPHQPHPLAEVMHAVRHEMAQHLDDWYLRRSHIGFGECHGIDSLQRVAELFAAERNWSASRRQDEIERARNVLEGVAVSAPRSSKRSA